MKRLLLPTLVVFVLLLSTLVPMVSAQEPGPQSLVSGIDQCLRTGDCTICDAIKVMKNIALWILGSVAAIALFFMVDGGFGLLTSGGNPEKIDGGKKKLGAAVIGLIIVVAAWTFVGIIIDIFARPSGEGTDAGGSGKLTTQLFNWHKIQCGPQK